MAMPMAMDINEPNISNNEEDDEEEDLQKIVMKRFKKSGAPEHRHLCALVGAMAQLLKDQDLPSVPTAYFAATMTSLDRHTDDPHVTTALCTFLSIVLTKMPSSVLSSKATEALNVLVGLHGEEGLGAGTIKATMKCMACLLTAADSSNWGPIAPSFKMLLNYSIDKRPKVRRCGQLCLEQVLRSFQGTVASGKASRAVQALFDQYLSLASNSNSFGDKKRAQVDPVVINEQLEVLHILNTLTLILPLLCGKVVAKLLPRLKALMDIRQPLLMRHALNVLQSLCSCPTAEVPGAELSDILVSLSLSISLEEKKPTDQITYALALLKHGMEKLQILDENLCAAKLPLVFHSIAGILACKNEEVIFGASDTLKSLIKNCINDSMIVEGINQVNAQRNSSQQETPIEQICAIAQSILDEHYRPARNIALQIISGLFNKLGESSFTLMGGTLKRLADLQKLPDKELSCRKQLHKCVGSAVAAMGPDKFLRILPLNLDGECLTEASVWLLPILKQHTVGADLQFFTLHIFPLASKLHEKTHKFPADERPLAEAHVHALWDLLPSFCNYPTDTAQCFESLAKLLIDAFKEEPKLHGIIASSLQILVKQNKEVQRGKMDLMDCQDKSTDINISEINVAEERVKAHYTKKLASKNIKTIASFASEFLPVLFNIFILSPQKKRKQLQSTIGCIASISKKAVIKDFFVFVLQRFQATQNAGKVDERNNNISVQTEGGDKEEMETSKRCMLLDLVLPLIQGLDEEVDMIFMITKPALQDDDELTQKKAYKVLISIFKEHVGFLSRKLDETVELMLVAKPLYNASTKKRRLECLHNLILYIFKGRDESMSDITLTFLSEIILAVKNSNKKIRTSAYEFLVQIGHGLVYESSGSSNEDLLQFFSMIVSCLAGTTPHMISAAIAGLARLFYDFSDCCLKVPNLLPSAFLLLHSKTREVVESTLGFMKVVTTRLQAKNLQRYLPDIVEGLLIWSNDSKNHFKLKVRLLLEMLIRKCGVDAIRAHMAPKHMELLKSIVKKRKEKANWKEACSQNDPEAADSFRSSASVSVERSPNVSISKKRKREESVHLGGSKPEAGLNDSKATIKECTGRKQKRHLINFKPRSHSADQSSRNQANSAGASRPKFQNEHKISKLRKKPERSMSSSSHLDAQNASSRSVGKTTRQKKSFDGGLSSCGKGKRSAARKKVGTSINSGPNIMHSPSAKLSMPKRKQKFNKRKGKKNTSE
eukprot:Gb_09813 [translate_table: standard]